MKCRRRRVQIVGLVEATPEDQTDPVTLEIKLEMVMVIHVEEIGAIKIGIVGLSVRRR